MCLSSLVSGLRDAPRSLPWALTALSLQARLGWSSVRRAQRTWHTWTTGPTRRGVRRSRTPVSSRSLPTATLVGTPPRPRAALTLCSSLLSSLSIFPSFRLCLSLTLSLSVFLSLPFTSLVSLSLSFYFSTSSSATSFFWPFCLALSPYTVVPPLVVPSLVCSPTPHPAQGCFL